MGWQLGSFENVGLTESVLADLIAAHRQRVVPQLERLWTYYRNPITPWWGDTKGRWYAQGQEVGLPARLRSGGARNSDGTSATREVVIENDIGWRVQSMVDFVFGKPVLISSTAEDPQVRRDVERVLGSVWEHSGGISLLQDMGTLGHVYGHVDLVLRADGNALSEAAAMGGFSELGASGVQGLRVEVIEPRRGIARLDDRDYRRILAYVVHGERERAERQSWRGGVLGFLDRVRGGAADRSRVVFTEVISDSAWQVYEDGELLHEESLWWTGGRVPVAHVQNISQPFCYGGLSEVEALIPLQDELNARLSDRAHRVTMQSFRMYLAKGVENFDKSVVGPGQVWYTDNMGASIEAFGGGGDTAGEEDHIREVREAMDKVSSVPPLAGGVVQARIGNLSSANALRITLMGLLAKTMRKRIAYGRAIREVSELALVALDATGVFKTRESDRGIALVWPDPLPEDVREVVAAAEGKQRLGVSSETVLRELGYVERDGGVVAAVRGVH